MFPERSHIFLRTLKLIIDKANHLFQEDLYQQIHNGLPCLTIKEWEEGKPLNVKYISLQPKGITSVYDVSEEDGGRSRLKDNKDELQGKKNKILELLRIIIFYVKLFNKIFY